MGVEGTPFRLSSEQSKYKLSSHEWNTGNVESRIIQGLHYHYNRPFSTHDNDNDNWSGNCAEKYHGAFWYWNAGCYQVQINGKYEPSGQVSPSWTGIHWVNLPGTS